MSKKTNWQFVTDPMAFARVMWPDVKFYSQQRDIIYSVARNDDTIVTAGNMLGKDFVAGFIVLWFFLTRTPCRVVTTSADGPQLEAVLWGEIRRFIQTAKYPVSAERGGPVLVNHLHLRKLVKDAVDPLSYCIGRVAQKGEGMLGHHIADVGDGVPRTLFVADEASGVDDLSWERAATWSKRRLAIGNPFPCSNFFRRGVKGGASPDGAMDPGGDMVKEADTWAPSSSSSAGSTGVTGGGGVDGGGSTAPTAPSSARSAPGAASTGSTTPGTEPLYYRRIIKIRGDDSPNVRYNSERLRAGLPVEGKVIIPGVLPWDEYVKRRRTWDKIRQCVSLDAEFYDGAEVLLFPPVWLNRAEEVADRLKGRPRRATGIGCDPAEGGDKSTWAVGDDLGLIELLSLSTPDTSVVPATTLMLMRKYDLLDAPECVVFDRGGGGKQHADRLAAMGYDVRTVGFGEAPALEPKHGTTLVEERLDVREQRYAYKNRRAQMYGDLRGKLDPAANPAGFALPREYTELRRQLAPIPLTYDEEGRLKLLPKNKRSADSREQTLTDLIGRSPDDADAVVLMLHGMLHGERQAVAGEMW